MHELRVVDPVASIDERLIQEKIHSHKMAVNYRLELLILEKVPGDPRIARKDHVIEISLHRLAVLFVSERIKADDTGADLHVKHVFIL